MKNFTKIFAAAFFLVLIVHCTLNIDNCKAQWILQTVPQNYGIQLSIDFIDSNKLVSCGWYNFYGRALYTSDGGTTWLPSTVPDSSRSFVTVTLVDSLTGYMAGAYNVFGFSRFGRSTDTHLWKGYSSSMVKHMELIGMNNQVDYRAFFVKTTDGGRNWFTHGNLPHRYTYLYDADFINANTGMLTTSSQDTLYPMNATIIRTTNGGFTWEEVLDVDSVFELTKIEYIDNNNIIAIGRGGSSDTTGMYNIGGMIFRSTNGGSNWSLQFFLNRDFSDLSFTNNSTGYISAIYNESALIYKTTNGGLDWSIIFTQSGNNTFIEGINFYEGSGTGLIFGEYYNSTFNNFVRRTSDYGVSWGQLQLLDTSGQYILHGSAMVSQYINYISGGNPFGQAAIFHTTTGGIVNINNSTNSIPSEFSLSQNYPNPFNPVTNLEFGISKLGFVSLKIYDLLGKEVTTLVNEKLSPGKYKAEFDGSNLTSGVYFYRIETERFSITKKMLMIK